MRLSSWSSASFAIFLPSALENFQQWHTEKQIGHGCSDKPAMHVQVHVHLSWRRHNLRQVWVKFRLLCIAGWGFQGLKGCMCVWRDSTACGQNCMLQASFQIVCWGRLLLAACMLLSACEHEWWRMNESVNVSLCAYILFSICIGVSIYWFVQQEHGREESCFCFFLQLLCLTPFPSYPFHVLMLSSGESNCLLLVWKWQI